jgi:hypothetical protein
MTGCSSSANNDFGVGPRFNACYFRRAKALRWRCYAPKARLRGHILLQIGRILLIGFGFQPEGAVAVMLVLMLDVSNGRVGDFRFDPGHAIPGCLDKMQEGSLLVVGQRVSPLRAVPAKAGLGHVVPPAEGFSPAYVVGCYGPDTKATRNNCRMNSNAIPISFEAARSCD